MAIIKCKMCGGDMELAADKTFGTCEFCGSTMTLPKVDDDQRAAAFNRGNHFRRIGEFDKALAVYERIVREDDTDAEAHWCCALCRFGIEYVEDPTTYEYLPTCHRASFDSFLEDVDYLAALEHSDGITRRQYQKDGAKIAEVQRGILATSQNAEPYDVFICYKESDGDGQRTRDSLLAQDIYYQLTEQGRKVFFARITLEDVAGTQYEPYIFAALNSAKVMIVVGTKPEHLNAVWVKNEWSRFLAMMKKDRHKLLLPCYRDMDPYDLPEALSVLQSYDMSKIGFIQDLTRGIAKVLDAEQKPEPVKETVVVQQTGGTTIAPLLERVFMFLEDGDWNSANEYCEKVLDLDPKNARAYLGKLMARLKVRKQEDLKRVANPFDQDSNYQKAVRFADEALKAELAGYIDHINTRNENARLEDIYTRAKQAMKAADSEAAFGDAANQFESIRHYQDSEALARKCREKESDAKKDSILADGYARMSRKTVEEYEQAIRIFSTIPGWKDADEQIEICKKKIEELKAKEEADRLERERKAEEARREKERIAKRNKKILMIAAPVIVAVAIFLVILTTVIIPNGKYNDAIALMEAGNYAEAISAFEAMEGYKDSADQILECEYRKAVALMDAGEYSEAVFAFKAMKGYKDSADQIAKCNRAILDSRYNAAVALMEAGNYTEAISAFESIDGYKDSAEQILECEYRNAVALMDAGETAKAAIAFGKIADYRDARAKSFALWDKFAARETISTGGVYTVGLKSDGTVVAVGSNSSGQCEVSDWTDIVAISAGGAHTVGLKSDGTVVAVGYNYSGQCRVSDWTDIVAISAGDSHTVGLKSDGTVVAVGYNDDGRCDVSDWTDIVAISAGWKHTVGLKSDGTVVAVGYNDDGRCEVSDWTDIVAISAEDSHTVGLKSDGTVVAVGSNSSGQCDVSDWTDIVAIRAGGIHTVGLKSDGTVVAVGYNDDGQCEVSDWTDIVAISAGALHTVGLKSDGTVVAVGDNDYGQCEVSDWKNIRVRNVKN